MGYDIHIGRAKDWTEAKSAPIRLEEWLALIQSDPEMGLDACAAAKARDGILRGENQGLAAWKAYFGNGNMAWFDDRMDALPSKNPDNEIVSKL